MSILQTVTKGKIKRPHLMIIYGVAGVGKTTFAASAPSPIFLCAEDGTNNLDVARIRGIQDWEEIKEFLLELHTEKHSYKTLVIDSIDWLEQILFQKICGKEGVKNIENACGGYGKAYTVAYNEFKIFINSINVLRSDGMNIVLIAHSQISKFSDPQNQSEYNRYEMKLSKKNAELFKEYVDCVLFANYELSFSKQGNKTRVFGEGNRFLYTENRPGYDAKNRFSLPEQISLNWPEYASCIESDIDVLKSQINDLLVHTTDKDLKEKVAKAIVGADIKKLENIKIKLEEKIK